uniref:AMOP domain-containing protein n=1 Tax=Romanomermis culicivorax TaxID=13658 RepID=A0A915J020_ROMCU
MVTSFAWYFYRDYVQYYGEQWALHRCIDWFENDGRWRNFWPDIEPCPCKLDQALYDFGRFIPFLECDMTGDGGCYFHRGSQHCVMSIHATNDPIDAPVGIVDSFAYNASKNNKFILANLSNQ